MLLLPLSVLSDRRTQFFLYKKYHKHDNDAQKIHIVKQKNRTVTQKIFTGDD